ncbi:MAG: hypothetical protein ACTHNW_21810 [Mucilaginibacter sp.]
MKIQLKHFVLMLCIMLISIVKSYAQQGKFEGNWLINQTKSSFGIVPFYTSVKQFDLKQTGNIININSIIVDQKGQADSSSSEYITNGQPTIKKVNDKLVMKASLSWSETNHCFTRTAEYSEAATNVVALKANEVWTLSADGRELTMTRVVQDFKNPQRSYTTTAVFDKQ